MVGCRPRDDAGWMMMMKSKPCTCNVMHEGPCAPWGGPMSEAPPQQNSMTAYLVGELGPVRGVEFKSYIDKDDAPRSVQGKSRTTVRVTLNNASVYLSLDDFTDAALAVIPPWFLRKKLGM